VLQVGQLKRHNEALMEQISQMEQSHITAKKDALEAKQITETTLDQMYAIQS